MLRSIEKLLTLSQNQHLTHWINSTAISAASRIIGAKRDLGKVPTMPASKSMIPFRMG